MPKPPIILGAFAVAAALFALVPAATAASAPSKGGAPFAFSARRDGHGVVTAIDAAGSYAYVTVAADDGSTSVTATLGTTAVVGDVVDLALFGHRDVFVSQRLHKTFSPLEFGVVTPRR